MIFFYLLCVYLILSVYIIGKEKDNFLLLSKEMNDCPNNQDSNDHTTIKYPFVLC